MLIPWEFLDIALETYIIDEKGGKIFDPAAQHIMIHVSQEQVQLHETWSELEISSSTKEL